MLEGRRYILKETAGLIFGIDRYPEVRLNPDDDYTQFGGLAIGMEVHMEDVEIDPIVLMDSNQAKELIKALKKMRRELRRKGHSQKLHSL